MPRPRPALRCPPPGATIAVVAPAGPADAERVAAVPALLAAQGWRARVYPGCHARHGFLAGDDAQRLADLQAALADPEVAAIWCLRGGWGSARLLGALAPEALARAPRLLIGYSDITALQIAFDRAGLSTLHAPMPASDLLLPGREADAQALFTLLREGLGAGTLWAPPRPADALRLPGVARGRLLGGNLSVLAALVGTPWQPVTRGRLLFLEDVGEEPYRVDRALWQLQAAGLLDNLAGVLLGSFTEAADPRAVLDDWLRPLGVPVLGGWPTGHGSPHQPLPLGALATLDATAGTLRLDEDVLKP